LFNYVGTYVLSFNELCIFVKHHKIL
jgi:hypothetical protein